MKTTTDFMPIVFIFAVFFFIAWISSKVSHRIDEASQKKAEILASKEINKRKSEINDYAQEKNKEIDKKLNYLAQQAQEVNERIRIKESLLHEIHKGSPTIANHYANIIEQIGNIVELSLIKKKNPAPKAALEVKEIASKWADAEKRASLYQGLVIYYESLFPALEDFKETPINVEKTTSLDDNDISKKYLTSDEYKDLSCSEKFQLALERYCNRKKSNWEIGRSFERYVGYLYEQAGYDVVFFGAIKGLEDLGRDLIAKQKGITKIIQCKYWAKNKVIHEKHLFQLYGTGIVYQIDTPKKSKDLIQMVFITSCTLSDTAREVAKILNIEVKENFQLKQYPLVKCNVGNNGDKIYHLPFDQQYDKIKIEPHKGESYVMTVFEAENAGFRRALRWKGQGES